MPNTRWYGLVVLLLFTALLPGQLSQQYARGIEIPGKEGKYQISFTAEFLGGGEADGPETILLDPSDKVLLKVQSLKVTGPDPAVARELGVKLELPASAGGASFFLSKDYSHERKAIDVLQPGKLGLFSKVFVIYEGRRLRGGTFDLTRTFKFREETPPVPAKEQVIVEAPKDAENISREAVEPPERKDPPEWEIDFANLSPEEFIRKWSNKRTLVRKMLRRIELQPMVTEIGANRYELTFDFVRSVSLDSVTGGAGYQIELNEQVPPFGHHLIVAVTDAGSYKLHLSDKTKEKGRAVVALDNLLVGELMVTEDTVVFAWRGGVPPYELLFYQKGNLKGQLDLGHDTVRRIALATLREQAGLALPAGEYTAKLQDQQKTVNYNFGGTSFVVPKAIKKPVNTKVPLLVGGGLAALALLLGLRSYRRRRRRRRIRENLTEKTPPAPTPSPAPASAPAKAPVASEEDREATVTTPIFKEITTEEPVATAEKTAITTPSGFKVTRRAKSDRSGVPFHPDERPHDFLPLSLARNWAETQVETIYFNKPSIFVLDDFLRRENTSKIAGSGAVAKAGGWERNEAIPEIGGMLLGQFHQSTKGGTYRVSVEEFVPLKAKTQNVVKVQIDPLSLARDLSAAQDEHPELTVVGWFHTHPGHGLFLSQPDLKVQYGQFREPYHFAMEIDSLTENLDTAFFTYLPDGQMNNRDTRILGSAWFSWSEIEKFTRRNSPV